MATGAELRVLAIAILLHEGGRGLAVDASSQVLTFRVRWVS